MRSSIQTLTKSAHPLGKLMDFLQEDVDSMQVSSAKLQSSPDLISPHLMFRGSWTSGRRRTRACSCS